MYDKKKILKNIATLSVSELVNKGIVLITTLYLMRVVTPNGYGVISFGDSFSSFFLILVVLAFYQIGSREIAKKDYDISKIVNTIITSRLILAVFTSILYLLILNFINISPEKKTVSYIYMIILFTNALNLDWAFQGMEKMGVMATRQVLTSSLTLIGYLIFVKSRADVIPATLITTLSAFLNVILLLIYYHKKEFKFRLQIDKEVLKVVMKSLLPLTIYILAATLLNKANILIMEYYKVSAYDIGIFGGAFKFITFGVVPSNIIQMSFFQLLARTREKEERLVVYNKFFTLNILVGCFIFMIMYLSPEIITLALKKEFSASIPLFQIYVISGIIMYMNTSVTPALIAWNYEKKVMQATIIGSIISLAANFILIQQYGNYGAVYASIIGEATIFILYAMTLFQIIQYNFIKSILKVFFVLGISVSVGLLLKNFGLNVFIVIIIVSIIYYLTSLSIKLIDRNELKNIIKR